MLPGTIDPAYILLLKNVSEASWKFYIDQAIPVRFISYLCLSFHATTLGKLRYDYISD